MFLNGQAGRTVLPSVLRASSWTSCSPLLNNLFAVLRPQFAPMRIRAELNKRVRRLFIVENRPFIRVDWRRATRADSSLAVGRRRYLLPAGRPDLPSGAKSKFRLLSAPIIAARLSRSTAHAGLAFNCWNVSTKTKAGFDAEYSL